jgi:hypothetical protein
LEGYADKAQKVNEMWVAYKPSAWLCR